MREGLWKTVPFIQMEKKKSIPPLYLQQIKFTTLNQSEEASSL